MKNGICYVVGAGTNYGLDFCPGAEDYVIAADAGFRYLEMQGIPADLIIGAFDSLKSVPKHLHTIVLPPEKDDTDMLARVSKPVMKSFIFIVGRVDESTIRSPIYRRWPGCLKMVCRVFCLIRRVF